jgi:soluble lytic murein transglycosylase-like protein
MSKRLNFVLMASLTFAASFSFAPPWLRAEADDRATSISTTTDETGHKVYVNDGVVAPVKAAPREVHQNTLAYWSASEQRWKSVPQANIRAARSAAAEVSQYLDKENTGGKRPAPAYFRQRPFTQQEIDAAIEEAATRHNVDSNLVRAVIKVESNFNPNAVSRKGAMGLMQLMPQTARQLNVSNPFDPAQNVDAGVRHLKQLMENYGGDVKMTLAAYNAGEGAVARSAGIPHFAETRNYVKRITQLYNNGVDSAPGFFTGPVRQPVRVERDARGILYISNTD